MVRAQGDGGVALRVGGGEGSPIGGGGSEGPSPPPLQEEAAVVVVVWGGERQGGFGGLFWPMAAEPDQGELKLSWGSVLQAEYGGGWTSRISGLWRSFHSQPTPESTQLTTFGTKALPQGEVKETSISASKPTKIPPDLPPEAANVSPGDNNTQDTQSPFALFAQDPLASFFNSSTYTPTHCTHTGSSIWANRSPSFDLESDSHKFCSQCIQAGISQKSPILCNHVHCSRQFHRLSLYSSALSHSCSSACIEAHVCKHHECHRCVESEGARTHIRRRASHPGAYSDTSLTPCGYQHKITIVDKGFPPFNKKTCKEGDDDTALRGEAAVSTGAKCKEAAQETQNISDSGAQYDAQCPSDLPGTQLAGHSTTKTRFSERNTKVYQSFSKKWQRFIYKWSSSSETSKDSSSKAEEPPVLEESVAEEPKGDKPPVVSDTGRLSFLPWGRRKSADKKSDKEKEDEIVRDKNIKASDAQVCKSAVSSVSVDVATNDISCSDSDVRTIKKNYDALQSTSESVLYKKTQDLQGDVNNYSAEKGNGQAKSGQISVLSCPSLHPVKVFGAAVSDESLDPTVSSDSGANVTSYGYEIRSLSEDSKTVSEGDVTDISSVVDDQTFREEASVDKSTESVDNIGVGSDEETIGAKDTSYSESFNLGNIRGKSSEDVYQTTDIDNRSTSLDETTCSSIFGDDRSGSVQQITGDQEQDIPQSEEDDEDSIERRSSVASTASEGRGGQRVNRLVNSTLGRWKRFQGSLGSLTSNIRHHYHQRLSRKNSSKEETSIDISTSLSFEKGEEIDLVEEEAGHSPEEIYSRDQKRSASLCETVGIQRIEESKTDNFWGKKREQRDLEINSVRPYKHSYHSTSSKDSDTDSQTLHEDSICSNTKDALSLPYEVVSPLSGTECATEISSASNSSGTTSSEGGDASIQSFLSVIAKKGKKSQSRRVSEDTCEEGKSSETIDICYDEIQFLPAEESLSLENICVSSEKLPDSPVEESKSLENLLLSSEELRHSPDEGSRNLEYVDVCSEEVKLSPVEESKNLENLNNYYEEIRLSPPKEYQNYENVDEQAKEVRHSPSEEIEMEHEVSEFNGSLHSENGAECDEVVVVEEEIDTMSKHKGRRRSSKKMSRESRDNNDAEDEPLPKRPSFNANTGKGEDSIPSEVQRVTPSSKNVQSDIVNTRRRFCEGMMGSEPVGVSEIDSDHKPCDNNSSIKGEDLAITSALEVNTHEKLVDGKESVDIGANCTKEENVMNVDHTAEDSVDRQGSECITTSNIHEEIAESTLKHSVDLCENLGEKEHKEAVVSGLPQDELHDEIPNGKTSSDLSKLSLENIGVSDNDFHTTQVVEAMDVSNESEEDVTLKTKIPAEKDIHRKHRQAFCLEDSIHTLGESVDQRTIDKDQGEIVSSRFAVGDSDSGPSAKVEDKTLEEMDTYAGSKPYVDNSAFILEEDGVADLDTNAGPKIVVTGAIGGIEPISGAAPAIVLEVGSNGSGDDSLLEGVAQSHGETNGQQSSSTNLSAHLAAHPHRPPTPKSPITVDEWVAALPHPTSVDDEGEAWSGCEQSAEDMAEDLLSLGDEAGLMSGSVTRSSTSVVSLHRGAPSTSLRESAGASHFSGAQNSESSTNLRSIQDDRASQLSITSPQHHGKAQPPLSPSHYNRPITLSDVVSAPRQVQPPSPAGVESRRLQFASLRDKQTSFQSDLSGLSLQSKSSIDSLLDSRQADPVDVLLSLGFGSQSQEGISRIPERFLRPSKVRGNNIDEFIKSEDEFSDMMESAEWMPGLDPQALRRASVATVSPLMSQLIENMRENLTRVIKSKEESRRSLTPQASLKGASRFASVAKKLGTKSAIMNTLAGNVGSKLSVLNPENRRLLDLQGQKSPEVPRKRLIIGQSSFDLGRDGELIDTVDGDDSKESPQEDEESIAEDEELDEDSSEVDDDDDEMEGVLLRRHRPLQKKESVWSIASSATSVDSSEEEIRDQRQKLQLMLNRRPVPSEAPATPPTPADSLDSPGLADIDRRRKLIRRLSSGKRVSTVSSGGSWDLDEKIPEEEMEEESPEERIQDQIISESQSSLTSCSPTTPPGTSLSFDEAKKDPDIFGDRQGSCLMKSNSPNENVNRAVLDRLPSGQLLPNFTNVATDSNLHRPDAFKSRCALPHLSGERVMDTRQGCLENSDSQGDRKMAMQQRSIASLRRQDRVEEGNSPCGTPLSPSMLQIPNHLADQEEAARSGNNGPLHRSGSAQSDSSGFLEGEVGDGEHRNGSSSQAPNASVGHSWWWSRESGGSMDTVRHMPISNAFAGRLVHGSQNHRSRRFDPLTSCVHENGCTHCDCSSPVHRQHGNHFWKHRGDGQFACGSSCSHSSRTSSMEYPVPSGSSVSCPRHSDNRLQASDVCCPSSSATAPPTVGFEPHFAAQCFRNGVCTSCVTRYMHSVSCPAFASSSRGPCCGEYRRPSLSRQRRNSLPESFHFPLASSMVEADERARNITPPSQKASSLPSKFTPPLSPSTPSNFIASSDIDNPVQPISSSHPSCSQLPAADAPAYLHSEVNSLICNQTSCGGNVDNNRIQGNTISHQSCQECSTPEDLLNAIQSYRSQLVQQEHLSRRLHATATFPLNNSDYINQQLHSISAIRAAIRAEVTHMEELIVNSKPNAFSKAFVNKVMIQMVYLLRKQAELCHDIEKLSLSQKTSSTAVSNTHSAQARIKCEVTTQVGNIEDSSKVTNDLETVLEMPVVECGNPDSSGKVQNSSDSAVPAQENCRLSISNPSSVVEDSSEERQTDSGKDCDSNPKLLKGNNIADKDTLCDSRESLNDTDRQKLSGKQTFVSSFSFQHTSNQTVCLNACDNVQSDEGASCENPVNCSDNKVEDSVPHAANAQSVENCNLKSTSGSKDDVQWIASLVETQVQNQTHIVQTHLHQQSREMEDIKKMLNQLIDKMQ